MSGESESFPSLEEVEEKIGYCFKDRGLLQQAFTDSTYEEGCSSYDRLEFAGDSMLNFLMAKEMYFLYPDLAPGKLTRLRAANVDTDKLARAAVNHGLHRYLRHKKPLLARQVQEFMDAIPDYPLHSNGLVDAPKVLADIVESTVGAVFVDSNSIDITWKVVKLLLEPLITPASLQIHPVTRLHETCQKMGYKLGFVDAWRETGTVHIFVNNEFLGKGIYVPKKLIALNRAADNAYTQLLKNLEKLDMQDND